MSLTCRTQPHHRAKVVGSWRQALAQSATHGGYRFAFSGPYVVQEEPDGSQSAVWWPEGNVSDVEPVGVPLDAPELRRRKWCGVAE